DQRQESGGLSAADGPQQELPPGQGGLLFRLSHPLPRVRAAVLGHVPARWRLARGDGAAVRDARPQGPIHQLLSARDVPPPTWRSAKCASAPCWRSNGARAWPTSFPSTCAWTSKGRLRMVRPRRDDFAFTAWAAAERSSFRGSARIEREAAMTVANGPPASGKFRGLALG